jgi:hypothetical protein
VRIGTREDCHCGRLDMRARPEGVHFGRNKPGSSAWIVTLAVVLPMDALTEAQITSCLTHSGDPSAENQATEHA